MTDRYSRYNTSAGTVLILALLSFTHLAQAADPGHTMRQGAAANGYFELGLSLSVDRIPIVGMSGDEENPADASPGIGVVINSLYEWRGFFAEALYNSFGGAALGYRLHDSDSHRLEFVITHTVSGLDPETNGFESVEERNPDLVAGIRSSFYLPNSILQFSLLGDIANSHGGYSASVRWGKHWQIKNWNLHAMIGSRYFSDRLSDYYFGIAPEEVSDQTPLYSAGAGTLGEVDIGATLPLNQDWIFRSGIQMYRLPDSIVDSPLTLKRNAYTFNNSISYVF